jgi:hypothetical protein
MPDFISVLWREGGWSRVKVEFWRQIAIVSYTKAMALRRVLFFWRRAIASVIVLTGLLVLFQQTVIASPFGQGTFGADVPFGSSTSLAISLGGNVSLSLLPDSSNFSGTGSHTITVTSTDVVGYLLYAHSTGSTNMVNGGVTIPVSSNTSAGPLAVNSWGYNTNGSTTNFLGMKTTSELIKDAAGPYKGGDTTTVTYGALTSATKEAGSYATAVTYTAVAKNE